VSPRLASGVGPGATGPLRGRDGLGTPDGSRPVGRGPLMAGPGWRRPVAPPRQLARDVLAAALAALAAAPAAAQDAWMLMSRHGECAPPGVLGRRQADLADVAGPEDLAERMRRRGRAVTVAEVPGAGGEAVEVRVPSLELALLFVRPPRCRGTLAPPR
jgi:hypothetical protein